MGRPPQSRSGGWRSRPAALALALVAGSLVVAERADAQAAPPAAQGSGAITVALGQVVEQASQTVQSAAAHATTVQVQPANIAAPVAVQSPGSSTVVAQANTAGAAAASGNWSSTSQDSDQSQGGGPGSASPPPVAAVGNAPAAASGGPSQSSGQASQTAQNAGAQAATVQVQPVNIAIPITIGSPGASIVIVQTNGASSGATASNSSSTTQSSGQAAAGPAAVLPGQLGTAAPSPPIPGASGPLRDAAQTVVVPTGSGTTWIWNWIWNWTIDPTVPSVQLPSFPPWLLPQGEASQPLAARPGKARPPSSRAAAPVSAPASGSAGLEAAAVPAETSTAASSRIVQRPKAAPEAFLEPFALLPLPSVPAPSAGSGSVPAGLLFGAVAFLALYLGSIGLLFGRLSLASAPWRHQAYLTPQQRPG